MGIESFFGKWVRGNYRQVMTKRTPRYPDSVFLDMNGIFHKASQLTYGYGEFDDPVKREQNKEKGKLELRKEHIIEIIRILDEILRTLKPKKNLVLAPDGVANAAKIWQQKGRRYKKALEDSDIPFDSNAITPGTDFMFDLDEAMKAWLIDKKRKNMLPQRVIYSPHLAPGEGEHKIFDYIRKDLILPGDGDHVVYGRDADLIVLSLLCKLENVKLMRENYYDVMNVDILREIIIQELQFKGSDRERLIKDFSVIAMFVGNDFLPKPPSFIGTDETMQHVFKIYQSLERHVTNKDGLIDWKAFALFLNAYYKGSDTYPSERELFIQNIKEPPEFPYPEMELFNEDNFSMVKFRGLWYCKQFCPKKKVLAELYEDKKFYSKPDIDRMCHSYLKTMSWVLAYYTRGYKEVDTHHFYPYHYTPMIVDVLKYLVDLLKADRTSELDDVFKKEGVREITAIDQLMMVMPPKSLPLIPVSFQRVYMEKLTPISPMLFEKRLEGANKEWQAHAMIPPINPKLVFEAVDNSHVRFPAEMKNVEESVLNNVISTKALPGRDMRGRGRGGFYFGRGRGQTQRGRDQFRGRGRGQSQRGRGQRPKDTKVDIDDLNL